MVTLPKEPTFEVKSKQGLWAQGIDMQIFNGEITFICQNKNPPGLSHDKRRNVQCFQRLAMLLSEFLNKIGYPWCNTHPMLIPHPCQISTWHQHKGLLTNYVTYIWGCLDPPPILSVIVSNRVTHPSPLFSVMSDIWKTQPPALIFPCPVSNAMQCNAMSAFNWPPNISLLEPEPVRLVYYKLSFVLQWKCSNMSKNWREKYPL